MVDKIIIFGVGFLIGEFAGTALLAMVISIMDLDADIEAMNRVIEDHGEEK